jgi:hypothetical protein
MGCRLSRHQCTGTADDGTRSALIALLLLIPVCCWLWPATGHWAFGAWNKKQSYCCRVILAIVAGGGISSGNAQVQRERRAEQLGRRHPNSLIAQRAEYPRLHLYTHHHVDGDCADDACAAMDGRGAGRGKFRFRSSKGSIRCWKTTTTRTTNFAVAERIRSGRWALAAFFAYLLQAAAITWHLKSQSPESTPASYCAVQFACAVDRQ